MSKKKKTEPKAEQVNEPVSASGEMNQKDAEKLASKYLPKDRYEKIMKDGKEVMVDKFDVMYVTSDNNVFYKENEGSARAHARDQKLKLFKVEF